MKRPSARLRLLPPSGGGGVLRAASSHDPYKVTGKPTLDELQAEWGPFVANAGTYDLSGATLTLRATVAKNPRAQRENNFTRLTVKLDGNSLWLTPIDNEAGPIPNPVTTRFVRIE